MEPIRIKLSKPVEHGPMVISELVIERDLQAGDLRDLPANPEQQTIGHILDVVGKLSNQPPSVMSKISTKDIQNVSEVFERFF
jgi:hypothetical protein